MTPKSLKARQALERQRERGLCGYLNCTEPPAPGKSKCQAHLDANARRAKDRRLERTVAGLCKICGHGPRDPGYATCGDCRAKVLAHCRAAARRRRAAREADDQALAERVGKQVAAWILRRIRREKEQARREAQGLCKIKNCPEVRQPGRTMCRQHLDRYAEYQRVRNGVSVAIGKCTQCPTPAVPGRKRCRRCLDASAARNRAATVAARGRRSEES